ncbi:MAG: low-specificity L-threonine aldolase [Bacteroidia bacterium]|nr:low-specificity L-threonine aldolase [Bacteroidia bacterium]
MIDLRSDTVTKPSPEMLEYMMKAEVGDDVYGEDPSISALQEHAAKLFGKEAALFCPSGTMCNQIAIRIHTRPQDEVICDKRAHIYLYEGGGMMANSMVSVKLLDGDHGRITAEQVLDNINPDDPHFPRTSLIALENTSNKGGGSIYPLAQIESIKRVADEHGLALHLDGARAMNAVVGSDYSAEEMGQHFDTISLCLSKGLGAPVGSVLIGTKKHIKEALRVRKMMGGGMRQAGYLAAAGLYALKNNIERLKDDHRRATNLSYGLTKLDWVDELMPVQTNIVVFHPRQDLVSSERVFEYLKEKGIAVSRFGKGYIRMVTHLQLTDEDIRHVLSELDNI